MTDAVEPSVHLTPLHDRHEALGAQAHRVRRLADAASSTPGILEEHRAVRERAGLFDLSHMGELFVEGPEAGDALAAALVTRPAGADGGPGPVLDDLSRPTAGSSTT